ncbi:unnamed protein product [Hapterophycus canaliculatus]
MKLSGFVLRTEEWLGKPGVAQRIQNCLLKPTGLGGACLFSVQSCLISFFGRSVWCATPRAAGCAGFMDTATVGFATHANPILLVVFFDRHVRSVLCPDTGQLVEQTMDTSRFSGKY